MSKLFNIQDGGGYDDEMNGGVKRNNIDIDDDEIMKVLNDNLKNIDDYTNFFSKKTNNFTKDEDIKYKNIDQLKNDIQTGLKNNDTPYYRSIFEELRNFKKKDETGTTTSTDAQGATDPITNDTTSQQTGSTGNCIHIGIIDETGTFVGVKSISNTDNILFEQLKTIVNELKATNEKQINDAQKQPVATIYDKFVTSDANCVPTFITEYETKFWESKELQTLFDKVSDKNKETLPFTKKTSVVQS